MLVFIDESGDPGFKVSRGSSPVFTVVLVAFRDRDEAIPTESAISSLATRLRIRPEFKFNKCRPEVRDAFFNAVAPFGFCVRAIDRSSRTSCGIRRSRPSRTSNKPGRGASVPRSLGRCRPQALRFNPARFSFGFGGLGKLLLLLRLALGRRGRSRPTQSGGPPLFTPFLKVEGYRTHNRNSGFAALPQCDDLNARRVRNVPA